MKASSMKIRKFRNFFKAFNILILMKEATKLTNLSLKINLNSWMNFNLLEKFAKEIRKKELNILIKNFKKNLKIFLMKIIKKNFRV